VVGSAAEEKQIARRRDLLQAVGAKPKEKPEAFKTADALRDAAFRYMTGDAKKAFDISQEKDSLRDRYGRDYYGQSCLLARRMAEYGVPCTSVTFSSVGDACWHMHGPLIRWLKLMGSMLDRAVSALIEDLAERGMLEHTIVVLFSEMGLSPFWEPKPKTYPGEFDGGRNHWNACFSTVVAGGGFKGGKVVGESDEIGAYIKTRPVYPWDLWESVYQLMGIDPNGRLPNPSGCVAYVSAANACGWPRGGILKEIM
jgi:hypothetical protein